MLVAEQDRHRGGLARVGRQQVGRLAAHQHGLVTQLAGHPPRSLERSGIGGVHQAGLQQHPQRVQCRLDAQLRQASGVLQLQQLHGPFDVAEPTGTELEVLPDRDATCSLVFHPPLESTNLGDLRSSDPVRWVTPEVELVEQFPHQGLVPGTQPGPQQGLRLPSGTPLAVIGQVAAQSAHHGTVAAVGTQAGVDCERRLRPGPAEH